MSPAIWAAVATQAAMVAGAVLIFGAHAQNLGDAALFTLAEAVALPLVTTWVMRASATDGAAMAALPSRFELPRVCSIPVVSWAF